MEGLRIELMGPIAASRDGRAVDLGAPKQRALLALLAMSPGEAVSRDRIVDALWGEATPASAPKMVQLYVSQLRKALGDEAIATRGKGYALQVDPDAVDAVRFERLLRDPGDADAARTALGLWRGDPFAGSADEPFVATETRRLEELRLLALERVVDDELEHGRAAEAVTMLERLVAEHPHRERLHERRMLALYRSGRQGAALEAYQEARNALVSDLGIEPGAALRDLHEAILRQDPGLDPRPDAVPAALEIARPLAGRDAELDALRAAWREAQTGGQLVWLVGPPGIGKTALAGTVAAECHHDGARVVHAEGAAAADALAHAVAGRRRTVLVLDGHAPDALPAARPGLLVVVCTQARPAGGGVVVELGPLGLDAIDEIGHEYAGADGTTPPPELLLDRSGGVPARVHAAAAAWARREAAARVRQSAGQTAERRLQLRELEAQVATDVAELQRAEERDRPVEAPAQAVCPFKGLAAFEAADADYYFGRERLVSELVARTVGAGMLGIVGPSGSGKSSAMRAGLLPALASGVLPGSEGWRHVLVRPGEHPLAALADALGDPEPAGALGRAVRGATAATRLVIAVDQFEELFTACADEHERAAFADALAGAAQDRERALVICAIRADYYGHCAAYPALAAALDEQTVLVGPPTRAELRAAIERPAERAGLYAEPELASTLADDVGTEPGALPLLSTALLELWQNREGRRLTLGAYERSGGVHSAVARLAESAYGSLDEGQRAMARRLFLRLAGEGEGEAVVRRRVGLDELGAAEAGAAATVLARLADRRLVSVDDRSAEVAHEALLREWPRLRAWLEEDAEGRRVQRHLAVAARDWDASGRDTAELYRGSRLAAAQDWAAAHPDELNPREQEFLDASGAAAQSAAAAQRRTNRRLRTLLGGVGLMLAVALAAGLVALHQRGSARSAATVAQAERLGARALLDKPLDRSLLLAAAAFDIADSPETRGNLLAALLRSPAAVSQLRIGGNRVLQVGVSPDGRTLAVGDNSGVLYLFAAGTHHLLRPPLRLTPPGAVYSLAFARKARLLAAGGPGPRSGFVRVLDTRTGRVRFSPRGIPGTAVDAVALSPDGRTLYATSSDSGQGPVSKVWVSRWSLDAPGARPVSARVPVAGGLASLDLAPDGRRLVAAAFEDRVVTIDARTLRVSGSWHVRPSAAALSPDGRTVAFGRDNGSVWFLDLASGRLREASGRHDAQVQAVRFSPDGGTLVTGGDDGKVLRWDVGAGSLRETWDGHTGRVTTAAFSPDGGTVFTGSLDGSVIAWDLTGDRRLGRPFRTGPGDGDQESGAVSPDGRWLATVQSGGVVVVTNTRTLRMVRRIALPGHPDVHGVAFLPDGRLVAIGGPGYVAVIDATSGRVLRRLPAGQSGIFLPAIASHAMATIGQDGVLRRWRLPDLTPLGPPHKFSQPTNDVSIAPDGRTLAVTLGDGTIDVLDLHTLRLVRRVRTGLTEQPYWSRFSPDGRLFVVGDTGGSTTLYDPAGWQRLGRPLTGPAGFVLSAPVSRDGRLLAVSSTDGTVTLFDAADRRPLGTPLPIDANRPVEATFTPDGSYVFGTSADGQGVRWDVRPAAWRALACRVAGRDLTAAEWADVEPDRPYQHVCVGTGG